jgi:hypothetical protein
MQRRKENWISPRDDVVHAKGKGEVLTYWVLSNLADANTKETAPDRSDDDAQKKEERIIDWQVDLLFQHLKGIVANRGTQDVSEEVDIQKILSISDNGILDEVSEAITLP